MITFVIEQLQQIQELFEDAPLIAPEGNATAEDEGQLRQMDPAGLGFFCGGTDYDRIGWAARSLIGRLLFDDRAGFATPGATITRGYATASKVMVTAPLGRSSIIGWIAIGASFTNLKSYFRTKATMIMRICMRAMLLPMQVLGPPPKGM